MKVLTFYDLYDLKDHVDQNRLPSFKIYFLENNRVLFLHSYVGIGGGLWITDFKTYGLTYFALGRKFTTSESTFSFAFEDVYTYPEQNIYENTFLLPVINEKYKINIKLEILCKRPNGLAECYFVNNQSKYRGFEEEDYYITSLKI
ncbi:hypothetical protein ND861_02265 [Leptospira sp. 2 VSF19]|uniref:Uncharacterized protein n=1 Tax=Leptospira soteropolitanensis TaxID=2950025 RepID=A0AAW5VG55_9LEPT|nr:hypothetical protein [Leptospira soteropolitanensis]MCW7491472.1 hypothetical protein [Leptospira soteropolitanensis]MCW7499056.1 hypothetical protein [Leptospira soteropolitanensis]MCW7521352.1 hypothetical protein [Leptospira soteropolitanensis]MCW7525160.1 hypothetical protein [Leptospira soteropolitanensis]MCW7529027.1 hypothetical protein [Leptospira soteropolitanensis]